MHSRLPLGKKESSGVKVRPRPSIPASPGSAIGGNRTLSYQVLVPLLVLQHQRPGPVAPNLPQSASRYSGSRPISTQTWAQTLGLPGPATQLASLNFCPTQLQHPSRVVCLALAQPLRALREATVLWTPSALRGVVEPSCRGLPRFVAGLPRFVVGLPRFVGGCQGSSGPAGDTSAWQHPALCSASVSPP